MKLKFNTKESWILIYSMQYSNVNNFKDFQEMHTSFDVKVGMKKNSVIP